MLLTGTYPYRTLSCTAADCSCGHLFAIFILLTYDSVQMKSTSAIGRLRDLRPVACLFSCDVGLLFRVAENRAAGPKVPHTRPPPR